MSIELSDRGRLWGNIIVESFISRSINDNEFISHPLPLRPWAWPKVSSVLLVKEENLLHYHLLSSGSFRNDTNGTTLSFFVLASCWMLCAKTESEQDMPLQTSGETSLRTSKRNSVRGMQPPSRHKSQPTKARFLPGNQGDRLPCFSLFASNQHQV